MKRLFSALVLFVFVLTPQVLQGAPKTAVPEGLSRGQIMLAYFKNAEMDFQLMRSLGADGAGGGTPGEIFLAARDIKGGDPASWSAAFLALAEKVEADGRARLERGHKISAGESLLRAASYYRAAEYYGDPLSSKTALWGMACRKTFLEAMRLSPWHIEAIFIPFGKTFLPGYFLTPSQGEEPRKTLIAQSGFDGTAEEMYFSVGKAALERGYNVLLFEGPGQVGNRRFHPDSTFVPDTAPALNAVVNFALSRPEVAPAHMGLYGASFGGYFAISGAVGEPRLGALIADSPIINAEEYFHAAMGAKTVAMFQSQDLTVKEIRSLPADILPPQYRFALLNLCLRYGKPSVQATLEAMKAFRVEEKRIASLDMPALGMVCEKEGTVPLGQAERFAELAPEGNLHVFEEKSGANIHCQLDNMPLSWAVALDWLDEQFQ